MYVIERVLDGTRTGYIHETVDSLQELFNKLAYYYCHRTMPGHGAVGIDEKGRIYTVYYYGLFCEGECVYRQDDV